jgi:hypothetical protein
MAQKILDRFKLDGRTALVTGGAQGIGEAYAIALGEAGARLPLWTSTCPWPRKPPRNWENRV